MVVSQRRQTHPLHLLQQQRNVVDSLRDDVRYLIHAQSLAQSGIYLQIWANGKCKTRNQFHHTSLPVPDSALSRPIEEEAQQQFDISLHRGLAVTKDALFEDIADHFLQKEG